MFIEVAITAAIITAAVGFIGWRVWQTLRVPKGKQAGGGCGACPPKPAKP